MNVIKLQALLGVLLISFSCSPTSSESDIKVEGLSAMVDPFVGTGGHGHTFPGATLPYGMVQLSPDTRLEGWDGCSGYHYTDDVVYGFSHTHLSGTGISDYGDILLMPTTGKVQLDNGYETDVDQGYASRFTKDTEHASPGYYAVHLDDYKIDVALTTTDRAGMHRYVFPESEEKNVILDLRHRDLLLDAKLDLSELDQGIISGYRFSRAWAQDQKIFFVIQLRDIPVIAEKTMSDKFGPVAVAMRFTPDIDTLLAKVALSAVSIVNAKENLETEMSSWAFDQIKENAHAQWEEELGRIQVEGGTQEDRMKFYTALYHTMIAPNIWSDVNGQYRGLDDKIHSIDGAGKQYTVFSLWDTFRAAHPLFTIIQQERTMDFLKTFLRQYEQGGRLPVWELAANETNCMIGNHSISVITDAWMKGYRNIDGNTLLEAMVHSAKLDHFGLDSYKKNGCVLAGDESESVSKTLEYAYDDWCIAQFAKAVGNDVIYDEFMQRAQYYKNLYDPSSGFFRARMGARWFGPFDPAEVNFNYTEANAWQYSLFVPQDVNGLISAMGGEERFEKHLDDLFTVNSTTTGRDQADITGLIGQYAHGNEPSHHMAYLYHYIGKPWKSAEMLERIMDEMYTLLPDGLSGNEDCGQMSAWYVMSAMGMYQVTPGKPEYVIGTTPFDKITINLENNRTFIIETSGASEGPYVQSATLNGEVHDQSYISHEDVIQGGKLSLVLAATPDKEWGKAKDARPVSSLSEVKDIIPVPYIDSEQNTFLREMEVTMGSVCKDCILQYRIDKGDWMIYDQPITINKNLTLTIKAVDSDGNESIPIEEKFYIIDDSRSIQLLSEYANQYSAGGDMALLDYQRGSANFRTGSWQGYEGQDFAGIIDLGSVQSPSTASIGFLQDVEGWIFYPKQVSFYISQDGESFEKLKTVVNTFPDTTYGAVTQDFSVTLDKPLRYLKIQATNYGECPEWHPGVGGNTWLFTDEVVIK